MLEIEIESKMSTEKIENEILAGGELSEEKIENSLNYEILSTEEKVAIDEFCSQIDFLNREQILQYGEAIKNKILKFSDSVAQIIKTKNVEKVIELFGNSIIQVKDFDNEVPATLSPKGISGLFFNRQKQIEKIILKFSNIEDSITKMEKQLETQKIRILKDITVIDTIYKRNKDNLIELSLYIIAGEKKLDELKNIVLPELQKKAENNNQDDIQNKENMENIINLFDKKVFELKEVRILLIKIFPEIKEIQNNDSKLAEEVQKILRNTIPLWRNQAIIGLGGTNNNFENEQDMANVEAIKKNNQDILEILNKLLEVHKNCIIKRDETVDKLLKIDKEVKEIFF